MGCIRQTLTDTEKCAREIASITRLAEKGTIEVDIKNRQTPTDNGFTAEQQWVQLTQEDALGISGNWDYKNLKLYERGDLPHEVDACNVLDRLSFFIFERKLAGKK